ncbi:MAG: hypothetical protein JWM74_2062 [Myxococcaceae bacterium]|nr:hypothetical protein [Myxococcaceae bacterium]
MARRKVDDDVPDLALPPPAPVRPPPPKPGAKAAGAHQPGGGGGRELDDDDPFGLAGGGGSIELDVAPTPHSMRAAVAAPRASGTMAAVSQGAAPRQTPATNARMPASLATPRAPMAPGAPTHPAKPQPVLAGPDEIDPFDARALADFGEPPASVLTTPLYALRVKMRQAELRRGLSGRRLEVERTQAKLDDALVDFGGRARAILESKPGHHRMLEEVIAAEQLVLERDGKLAGEMSAHKARAAQVDTRLVELEAALALAQEEERKALEAVTRAEAARARAEAKIKRREIEARNEARDTRPR